jgi:hypothetical protein
MLAREKGIAEWGVNTIKKVLKNKSFCIAMCRGKK